MEDQREVQFDRAVEFAKNHGIHKVFETSAKTGSNVEDVFSCAGKELFHQTEKENEEAKEKDTDTPDGPANGTGKVTKLKKSKAGGSTQKGKKGCC